jgi:hypothetical protein
VNPESSLVERIIRSFTLKHHLTPLLSLFAPLGGLSYRVLLLNGQGKLHGIKDTTEN